MRFIGYDGFIRRRAHASQVCRPASNAALCLRGGAVTHIHSEAMRTCAEVERPGVAALLLLVADAHLAIKVAMLVDELASANVLLG